MSTGQIIIDTVIRSEALEKAELTEDGGTIFVWTEDAKQRIELALHSAGFMLVPIAKPKRKRK